MRNVINLNHHWLFCKDTADITVRQGEQVTEEVEAAEAETVDAE